MAIARFQRRALRGFTIAEMFLVMAIFFMIMGLVIPALMKARSDARLASCTANLKAIGVSFQQYVADHPNYDPLNFRVGAAWGYLIPTYLKTLPTCPGDTMGNTNLEKYAQYPTSYDWGCFFSQSSNAWAVSGCFCLAHNDALAGITYPSYAHVTGQVGSTAYPYYSSLHGASDGRAGIPPGDNYGGAN